MYQQPYAQTYVYPTRVAYQNDLTGPYVQDSNTLSVWAIVLGCISLLFFPILFGPAGIVCGIVAVTRRERLASVGLTLAIIGPIVGAILGIIVFRSVV
jgi:hypothetical protein